MLGMTSQYMSIQCAASIQTAQNPRTALRRFASRDNRPKNGINKS